MRKTDEKSELSLALTWIVVYCVLQSLANPLNSMLGIPYGASAAFAAAQAASLFVFMRRRGLLKRYGLCSPAVPARQCLYYVPLLILATRNFWNGMAINLNPTGTALYVICMLCVGFLEEVIFRGFLFRAMAEDNVKHATIVSSVTFGLGHLLNLINGSGASLGENLLQVIAAMAIGFLFVTLFDRSGSLLPCAITHAAINISSAFANTAGLTMGKRALFQLILCAAAVSYALVLTKTLPRQPVVSDGTEPDRE